MPESVSISPIVVKDKKFLKVSLETMKVDPVIDVTTNFLVEVEMIPV